MGKRLMAAVLAAVMLCSCAISALADGEGVEVVWLDVDAGGDLVGQESYYIEELDLFSVAVTDRETGEPRWLLIDRATGSETQRGFDRLWPYSQGLAAQLAGGKVGYLDCLGNTVIEAAYDYRNGEAGRFSEGLAFVPGVGYIDAGGRRVINFTGSAGDFSEGLAYYEIRSANASKYGYIDAGSNIVIPALFDFAGDFSGGLARVGLRDINGNMKYGYADSAGRVVIPFRYDYALDFSEGLAAVGVNSSDGLRCGYIDKNGEVVIPLAYDDADSFVDGLARVRSGGDWDSRMVGFIDKNGLTALAFTGAETGGPVYDENSDYGQGLIVIKDRLSGKLGFVDTEGRTVLPAEYDCVVNSGRCCLVEKDGRIGYFENPMYRPVYTLGSMADVASGDFYSEAAMWALTSGAMEPVSSGRFGAGEPATRADVVSAIWHIMGCPEPESAESGFPDVSEEDGWFKAVVWAGEAGVASGTDAGFEPKGTVTRGQIVTFLYRAAGSPEIFDEDEPFADVAADAWYHDAVIWAYREGIASGTGDGVFEPERVCTRGEAVTFVYRCVG